MSNKPFILNPPNTCKLRGSSWKLPELSFHLQLCLRPRLRRGLRKLSLLQVTCSVSLTNTGGTESLCVFLVAPQLCAKPIWTKFGAAITPRKAGSRAKFHLAAFLCCWGTVHKTFIKQQKLVKQAKNWTFSNGNETNCIVTLYWKMNFIFFEKLFFCSELTKKWQKPKNYGNNSFIC